MDVNGILMIAQNYLDQYIIFNIFTAYYMETLLNQNQYHGNKQKSSNDSAYNQLNFTKKIQNYLFKLNDIIGKGNFSKVYKALNQYTNQIVSIKVVELNRIKKQTLIQLLYSEIQILKSLNHPNILKCYQAFSSTNNCYIITEFCNQGDLQTKIRKNGPLNRMETYKTIYQIFNGLKYLAQQGIIHRDLKIANILLKDGKVKIADFGFSKRSKQKFQDVNIGSPIYMSPQGLSYNIYGPKTDVWAFGVLIYQLIYGETPLHFCKTENDLKIHIMYQLTIQKLNCNIGDDLKQLIVRCLDINQGTRITIEQIQNTNIMIKLNMMFNQKPKLNIMISQVQEINLNSNENHFDNTIKISHVSTQAPTIQDQHPKSFILNFKESPNKQKQTPIKPLEFKSQKRKKNSNKLQQLISPQNKYSEIKSPKSKIQKNQGKIFIDDSRKKNLSFQSLLIAPFPKRGVSIQRANNLDKYQSVNNLHHLKNYTFETQKIKNKKVKKILEQYSYIKFSQCVNLLHYCRLIYKSIILCKKEEYLDRLVSCYTQWLFDIIDEISQKVPVYIKYEHEQSINAKQKKLKQVINEYSKKYHNELTIKTHEELNLFKIQQITLNHLKKLDIFAGNRNKQNKDIIMLAHYLSLIYQTNITLEKCKKQNNYDLLIKNCQLEQWLSLKKQNYDYNKYLKFKYKLQKLIASSFIG